VSVMGNWLDVRRLSRRFPGGKAALQRVSLRITDGVTAVLGQNGSGKSTLLRCLASVLSPSSGIIRWNGADIWQDIAGYRWQLGYLPQEFAGYDYMSVQQFLGYMAALKRIPHPLVQQRINRLLEELALQPSRQRRLGQLSAGLLQQVGLAQALLNDPDLILLDEPTVGLDPEERLAFLDLIRRLAAERVIVLATHLISDAEAVADRLVVLHAGRLLVHATPASLLTKCLGLVWELEVTDIAGIPQEMLLSRSSPTEHGYLVRVLAPEQPTPAARRCDPSLEEAYLALVHGLIPA
jgi:ABC-2 type transport system ATP-binding protein